jgi:hypothetical protein
MTWEEKIRMAKETDPTLTDEKAAEVVHDLEQLAHLAIEDFMRRKRGGSVQATGTPE